MKQFMKASAIAIGLLKQLEGFSHKPYADGAGYMTVGYGHLLDGEEPATDIDHETGEILLGRDVAEAEDTVNRLVKVELNQHQYDALVCFVFNIGEQQFAKSGLLRELNKGNYLDVPRRMMMWNKITVDGKLEVSKGLTNRRKKEVKLWNGLLSG